MNLLTTVITGVLFLCAPFVHAEVNINTATETELTTLQNIGPAKAAAIVEYRTQHGSFKSVDDLLKVQGIGLDTLEKNRNMLILGLEEPVTKNHQKSKIAQQYMMETE